MIRESHLLMNEQWSRMNDRDEERKEEQSQHKKKKNRNK